MTSFGHIADVAQDPDGCSWKSSGIISVSGTLYLGVSRQGWTGQCANESDGEQPALDGSIVMSADDGRTWSNGFGTTGDPGGAAPQWDASLDRVQAMFPGQAFSAPFFINYGQDDNPAGTADGGDQYVYAVSDDGCAYDGNYLILGRVLRSQIADLNAADWQFYTGAPGGDGMNPADWSSSVSAATHIMTAPHEISQPDIQYYPSLHSYVLTSSYFPFATNWPDNGAAHSSNLDFFEASHPWGPWTEFVNKPDTLTVCYIDCTGVNTMPLGLYDLAQVSKFASTDDMNDIIFTSGDFTSESRYGDPDLYALHALPITLSSPLYHITDDFSPAVTYQGNWSTSAQYELETGGQADYYDQTLHDTQTPGNSGAFTFTGTSVQWTGSTNDNHGIASVSVDGGPAVQVDTYSPQGVKQQVLFSSGHLRPGRHTITITLTSNKNAASQSSYIDVDAFVTSGF